MVELEYQTPKSEGPFRLIWWITLVFCMLLVAVASTVYARLQPHARNEFFGHMMIASMAFGWFGFFVVCLVRYFRSTT